MFVDALETLNKGSIGAGPVYGQTLDIISDMVKWKRLRSTIAAGFSTRQLSEMIPAIDEAISKFKIVIFAECMVAVFP